MRAVLVGAVDFSRHCLEQVLAGGADVVGIVTVPEELAAMHGDYADLGEVADAHGIPVLRTLDLGTPDAAAWLRERTPDVIFVFGWSRLVPRAVLDLPPLGCIGTHPALLPRNRGRHPITWALVEGLTQSGLTFLLLDDDADSGDIVWQAPFEITLDDDAASLYAKVEALASEGIAAILPQLEAGVVPRAPQDHSQATYWRKRTDDDRMILWSEPTMTIYNLIRGLARPYIGALAELDGRPARVWRARLPDGPLPEHAGSLPAGEVIARRGPSVDVRTGDGYLTLVDVEFAA